MLISHCQHCTDVINEIAAMQCAYEALCINILLVHTLTTSDHILILIRLGNAHQRNHQHH